MVREFLQDHATMYTGLAISIAIVWGISLVHVGLTFESSVFDGSSLIASSVTSWAILSSHILPSEPTLESYRSALRFQAAYRSSNSSSGPTVYTLGYETRVRLGLGWGPDMGTTAELTRQNRLGLDGMGLI
jgi:hypothetical protein